MRNTLRISAAMIVAVASLMLSATSASAAGNTHYENVGNPGWCLDGDGSEAYLHRCGHGQIDFQMWTVGDAGSMKVKHTATGACLKALPTDRVGLGGCTDAGTTWYAAGKNGWVKFVSDTWGAGRCLMPTGTWQGGLSKYPLIVDWCDPNNHLANPRDVDGNVPNWLAWRWF
ncbi:hypothetical protein SAMN05444920_14044 [Nonomuraea solani]|uniref:Uncharacterized protein n=1 Tax=Nonomuraea solani TaxID=1144553 RepID=A0A1H6F0G3_9ACTN|nr:hypothetical protein [Nonomuraea solani]SEH03630.1 hypothetical protein SAMN05444920_14044 [Nonomuraea solani]